MRDRRTPGLAKGWKSEGRRADVTYRNVRALAFRSLAREALPLIPETGRALPGRAAGCKERWKAGRVYGIRLPGGIGRLDARLPWPKP